MKFHCDDFFINTTFDTPLPPICISSSFICDFFKIMEYFWKKYFNFLLFFIFHNVPYMFKLSIVHSPINKIQIFFFYLHLLYSKDFHKFMICMKLKAFLAFFCSICWNKLIRHMIKLTMRFNIDEVWWENCDLDSLNEKSTPHCPENKIITWKNCYDSYQKERIRFLKIQAVTWNNQDGNFERFWKESCQF